MMRKRKCGVYTKLAINTLNGCSFCVCVCFYSLFSTFVDFSSCEQMSNDHLVEIIQHLF